MKTIFEKIIIFCFLGAIAIGATYGVIAISSLRGVVAAEDKVAAVATGDRETTQAVSRLAFLAEAKTSSALHYMLTQQAKPYLEDMNDSRREFLTLLRTLREKLPKEEAVQFLNPIEQAEMEHQIYLQKAIDARRTGPNYIGIAITLENLARPKREQFEKALRSFVDFKRKQSDAAFADASEAAASKATTSNALLTTAAVISLGAGAAMWLFVMQMLYARRRRETASIQSEKNLRFGLDATELVTWERNLTTDLFDKTDRHLKIYGFTKDPPIWNFETFLRTTHPDDRDMVKKSIQGAIAAGGEYRIEFRVKWPDKTVRHVLQKARVILDEEGKPAKLVGFDTSLDRVKRSEEIIAHGEEQEDAPRQRIKKPEATI